MHIEENSDMRAQYTCTLNNALNDSMVSKLMTTPLYTAIIVLLVKMGGTPPTKRYSLFQEYCDVVIKREQQKKILPTINDEFEWIRFLHSQIGFLLQTESETKDNAAAELSSLRLKSIISKYLEMEGIETEIDVKTGQVVCFIIEGRRKFFGLMGKDPDISIKWDEIEKIGEDLILVRRESVTVKRLPEKRFYY